MKVLGRFLTPSGYLFVGPSEAFLAASSGFKSIAQSMCFAFRKNCVIPKEPAITARPRPAVAVKNSPKRPGHATLKARMGPVLHSVAPIVAAEIDLARVKQLGDAGKFLEAGELCLAHLKQHGPTFEAFHLLGLVRDAMGDLKLAEECYRKALYLEPNHSQTLLHLSLLFEKQGDTAGAQRLLDRARRAGKGART